MKVLIVSADTMLLDRFEGELSRLPHTLAGRMDIAAAEGFFSEHKADIEVVLIDCDDLSEDSPVLRFALGCRVLKPTILLGLLCDPLSDSDREKLTSCRIQYFERPLLYRRVMELVSSRKPPPKVSAWEIQSEKAKKSVIAAPSIRGERLQRCLAAKLFGG